MGSALFTVVNLTIAAGTFVLCVSKALAARHEPDLTLKLTASVLAHAAVIFLLAAPAVYRPVGAALGSPNLPALLINCATLLCVAHAHLMTQLWHPARSTPRVLRRAVLTWTPLYAGAIAAMTVLYVRADLSGPARPIRFAAAYAHVPQVVALQLVYLTALITGVVATLLQCRGLIAPSPGPTAAEQGVRPPPEGSGALAKDLHRSVAWFAVALALDLAHVVCSLTAMFHAVGGDHGLDHLADCAWLATIASGLAANHGLGRLTVTARREERRDYQTLRPLWRTVVRANPQLVLAPGLLWSGWDTRIALSRKLVEIRDGARSLSPWMSDAPARAVAHLARGDGGFTAADVVAAQAAATLLYAAGARGDGEPPADIRLAALPGEDVPAAAERAHLVLVARYLSHPVVTEAVALVRRDPAAYDVTARR
ncbi:DUF6545 domain-containing protein [Streptomyces sp. NPDC059063]|uniref:DUF6545 domain-containing protein n=1 Tax=unclassified Streptomyces TaxID=2593676 RepID=UPI0036A89F4D